MFDTLLLSYENQPQVGGYKYKRRSKYAARSNIEVAFFLLY